MVSDVLPVALGAKASVPTSSVIDPVPKGVPEPDNVEVSVPKEPLTTTTSNFGTVHQGATVANQTTSLQNAAGTYVAGLQVTSLSPGLNGTTVGTVIGQGSSVGLNAAVNTSATGTYNQGYTIGTSDDQTIIGWSANSNKTYTVSGWVYSGTGTWTTNGGGVWGSVSATPTNWTANGGTPGLDSNFTTTDSAYFGTSFSGTATVTLLNDSSASVSPSLNAVTFNPTGTGGFLIAQGAGGTGTLKLNAGSGTATLTDSAGNNGISAPVEFDSNVATTVASSDTLTLSGNISQSGTRSLTVNGPGSTVLSGNNTYSGGTAVASGSLFLTNTSGSGAGTGSLTVAGGATLGGTGSYGTTATPGAGYKIAGSSTSNRAQVLVGLTSASDTNTSNALSLIASTATITNANLTFNINDQVKGGLGTDPSNSGTELNVGSTAITFGLGMQATTLTVNVQNYGVIDAFTPYVLIAGNTTGAVDQYTGLSLGTSSGSLSTGLTTQILNSGVGMSGNLTLALTGLSDTWYGANSYLFLYQNSTTGADDIEVEVVPEPGTWALMLGGLAMLIFWQRTRRKL